MLYFDYQSSTPLSQEASESMRACHEVMIGNPHASHLIGQKAAQIVYKSKENIGKLVNAKGENIIFTSGATEANNHAIFGVLVGNKTKRNKILISAIEHSSVLDAATFYADLLKYQVDIIPVLSNGKIDLNAYEKLLTDEVCLVSIMHTNNEIGVIQDIALLAKKAHEAGSLFHTDAAQALTSSVVDVNELSVDLMSLSAHKLYGPQGIGALYISDHLLGFLPALLQGGAQQEGLRSGTVPVALASGFGVAAEQLESNFEQEIAHLKELRSIFLSGLKQKGIHFEVNGC